MTNFVFEVYLRNCSYIRHMGPQEQQLLKRLQKQQLHHVSLAFQAGPKPIEPPYQDHKLGPPKRDPQFTTSLLLDIHQDEAVLVASVGPAAWHAEQRALPDVARGPQQHPAFSWAAVRDFCAPPPPPLVDQEKLMVEEEEEDLMVLVLIITNEANSISRSSSRHASASF